MHSVGDSSSTVPAFLGKLWKLVEDPSTDNLISWNSNGVSFTIRDQARFARELLPLYYKHNNMASFIRQLNMYGFHKVVSVDSGGLKLDKDEMEFAHTYFLQGHEYLLEHIKRKISVSKQEDAKPKPEILSRILTEVRSMKGKQESVDSRLTSMKRENEALWREVAALRQKHMKQQQIVNKLIQFLISIVQPGSRGAAGLGIKRRYPLMLGEGEAGGRTNQLNDSELIDMDDDGTNMPNISISSPSGPIIHDVTDLMEEAGSVELTEIPLEETAPATSSKETPFISEIFSTEESALTELPFRTKERANSVSLQPDFQEELSSELPDFNTMVQLEGESVISSPLSPEMLLTIDPREMNCSTEKNSKEKRTRGKSVVKKPDMQLVVGEASSVLESREEFDHHLDTMQVDLDQLREVLVQQKSPIDAATLLGVCDTIELNFEPTLGVDSFNWNRRPSDSSLSYSFTSLLDQQMLPKLFSGDETLAAHNYLSIDMDLFKPPSAGAIAGNEVMTYSNAPLFDIEQETGEQSLNSSLTVDPLLLVETAAPKDLLEDTGSSVVDKELDLLHLLDEPLPSTTTTSAAIKKRKKH